MVVPANMSTAIKATTPLQLCLLAQISTAYTQIMNALHRSSGWLYNEVESTKVYGNKFQRKEEGARQRSDQYANRQLSGEILPLEEVA